MRGRIFVVVALVAALGASASAATIFTNTHTYAFGADPSAVVIQVDVFDNYMGDFGKYLWQYTVTNNSYDPVPGVTNGFSGFETALPFGVPDIGDIFGPAGWEAPASYSGQPVEWDIKNSDGLGVMPGEVGLFGYTTLPRYIVQSTGWFHTWINDSQDHIVNYPFGDGVEVPDVQRPPVPEPTSAVLFVTALAGGLMLLRRRRN